jgi:hypothetical protein
MPFQLNLDAMVIMVHGAPDSYHTYLEGDYVNNWQGENVGQGHSWISQVPK